MADTRYTQLIDRLETAYITGEHSDMTITCGDDTYHVHKLIVCSGCRFFAGAMRFGAGKEAEDCAIDLPDDDPVTVKSLLAYLYTTDYEPTLSAKYITERPNGIYTYDFPHTCDGECIGKISDGKQVHMVHEHHRCLEDTCGNACKDFIYDECTKSVISGDAKHLSLHAKIYAIADKYVVPGLQGLCCVKFAQGCKLYGNDREFAIAARIAYTTTPDDDVGLRKVVSETIAGCIRLTADAAIDKLLFEVPGLARDVLRKTTEGHGL